MIAVKDAFWDFVPYSSSSNRRFGEHGEKSQKATLIDNTVKAAVIAWSV
jgi:hypothetical protein